MNVTKVYILGAGSRGKTTAYYLHFLYNMEIEAYLVENDEDNPREVEGIPVIKINSTTILNTEYPVYIGTRGVYHKHLEEILKKIGFSEIYPVTVELDLKMRNAYLEKYYADIRKSFPKLDKIKPNVCIYVAKSVFDKSLQKEYQLAEYEKEIQVGAALTKFRFGEDVLLDCEGENISYKNQQYCELTALYWIWKHAKEDWIGLVHYRRHFILEENWFEQMVKYNIDVILPVPLCVVPDIETNYKERHMASDWDYMMQYLQRYREKDYQIAEKVFQGNLYSPCNMFIMKKPVLDELCSWLFPILEAIEMHGGIKENPYMNRYLGFISERLITLFFQINEGRYKVAYADKNFIE